MISIALQTYVQQLERLMNHLSIQQKFDAVNEEIQVSNLAEDVKAHINTVLQKNTDEKIFDYNSNIISLYGYWEQYVESVIKEYLKVLRNLKTENDVRNETIKYRYKNSLVSLFNKVSTSNPKFRHLTDEHIINAMYIGYYQKQNDYIPEAFYQSGGNYNKKETVDCFHRLGFKDFANSLIKYPALHAYYIGAGYTEETIKNASDNTLFAKLDNLVSYRNEIAHGGSDGTTLLNAEEVMEYVKFMRALGASLTERLNDDICEIMWLKKTCNEIEVRQYYDRLNVSVLRKGIFYIDTSNPVICYAGNERYPHFKLVRVQEMRVNGVPYSEAQYLSSDSNDEVSIIFNTKIKKGYKLKFEE